MITQVEVVARPGPGGRTVLPVVRARGQLTVRRTGPASVHLAATAFGPRRGDDAEVRLVVEEGATLAVRTAAAAVALPARGGDRPSVQRVVAAVAGTLDLRPEPTVVAARARLTAALAPGAVLTASEQVLLGRAGEEPGCWTGTTRVVVGDRPLLHTTVGLEPGAPAWLPRVAPRAYASTVHVGQAAGVLTADDAVRLPLEDGWVSTAWGAELHSVVRAVEVVA